IVAVGASLLAVRLGQKEDLSWPGWSWAAWVWPAAGLLVYYLIQPYLWPHPWDRLVESIAYHFPRSGYGWFWFLGEQHRPLPWYYYLVYLAVTTPPLVLGGAIIWLGKTLRQRRTSDLILACWLASPLLISFLSFKQAGLNYVFHALGPLALASAVGLGRLGAWLGRLSKRPPQRLQAGLAGLTLVCGLGAVAGSWPYHIDYYNVFSGGSQRICQEKLFVFNSRGEGLRASSDYLYANAPQGSRVAFRTRPAIGPGPLPRPFLLRPDLKVVSLDQADYAVTNLPGCPDVGVWPAPWRLVFEENFKGVAMSRVYRRQGRED
ncbi:MAG: hypothetical protein JRJ59_09775, partial [Deltaproteobacteria bacterium]|nr:hypothetical protein [Deltaproteobacteria bacterium]